MIEVSGIRKEYEGVAAVDCLDLTIEEGSFFLVCLVQTVLVKQQHLR